MVYYLAIDIGASSGRHILGHLEDGKLVLEEIYRFPNGAIKRNGHRVWDRDALFSSILAGMKRCKELGKIPVSMGIDTWAVDYVLLSKEGKVLGDSVAYRDDRTAGMDQKVYERVSEAELYRRTGIQKQPFNTIYQLMAVKENTPEELSAAERMLMIPEYFNYLLTGKMVSEYTNATTTQLVNANQKDWDWELISELGYPERIFGELQMPGTKVGHLRDEIRAEVGFDTEVILPATHDTASAVMAVPTNEENTLYISSGTWSLMGTELLKADCSEGSKARNFTNEGGFDYRYRYLKNIMGLWMIQSVRSELAPEESYGTICSAAAGESIPSIVPCNDARFLAPESMTQEIQNACRESGQPVPEGISEVAAVVYNSLAQCYAETAAEVESMTGKHYESIYVVGGGSQADYLNQLTAKYCKKTVRTGPKEATAIGNLLALLISDRAVSGLFEARELVLRSFQIGTCE